MTEREIIIFAYDTSMIVKGNSWTEVIELAQIKLTQTAEGLIII